MPSPAEILSPDSKDVFFKDGSAKGLNLSLAELFHVGLKKGPEVGRNQGI